MDSERIYNRIISNAVSRSAVSEYTEKHHILPRCIGGDDSPSNIVRLTAKEHYICHWLLTKFNNDKRLVFAWNMMCNNLHGKRYTSRTFAYARKAWAKEMSRRNTGVKFSEERLKNLSVAHLGQNAWNKGLKTGASKSDIARWKEYDSNPKRCKVCNLKIEYRMRLRRTYCSNKCAHLDPENPMKEARDSSEKRPNSGSFKKGRTVSKEAANKISSALTGMKRPRGECPHCGKEGAISLLKRWHFDNCKDLLI